MSSWKYLLFFSKIHLEQRKLNNKIFFYRNSSYPNNYQYIPHQLEEEKPLPWAIIVEEKMPVKNNILFLLEEKKKIIKSKNSSMYLYLSTSSNSSYYNHNLSCHFIELTFSNLMMNLHSKKWFLQIIKKIIITLIKALW